MADNTVKFQRTLQKASRSFFLFGPRGVGKSTWLRDNLDDFFEINLLKTDLQLRLTTHPEYLEQLIGARPRAWIWIDEVQKVPALLDEVHRLIEEKQFRFALSGSSARKLKKAGANLLGGRALTLHMEQFNFAELGRQYDIKSALEYGLLPLVVQHPAEAVDILRSYVHTYIREEIKEEGIVRRVEPFLRFLELAGALNGVQINAANISRDASVPRSSVDNYFSILVDTLIGHFLPAYTPQVKIKETVHPKFYWFDPGVARAAAGLITDVVDADYFGRAFETLIFHELRVYNEVAKKYRQIAFYRTQDGSEVDFIIELKKATKSSPAEIICIEVKNSPRWKREWLKPSLSLQASNKIKVTQIYGVYRGKESLSFDDSLVLPWDDFLGRLHSGKIY